MVKDMFKKISYSDKELSYGLVVLVFVSVLVMVVVFYILWFNSFRFKGVEEPSVKDTGSMFELVFSEKITNGEYVEENLEVLPSNNVIVFVHDNRITISPVDYYTKNTDYLFKVPVLESSSGKINDFKFRYSVNKDYSGDIPSSTGRILVQKNKFKLNFLDDSFYYKNGCFSIQGGEFDTTNPFLTLYLDPEGIKSVPPGDKYLSMYDSCFDSFKKDMGLRSIDYKSLNLRIVPPNLQSRYSTSVINNYNDEQGD